MFGGWALEDDLCARGDFAVRGDAEGVPMGAVLGPRPADAVAPRLAVRAERDPGSRSAPGTPLERIQVVKGWVEDGEARERVYHVAGDDQGLASVDPATCEPTDASAGGADALCRVWSDPDFDPAERAFYYARVVETPTCRWSQRLCNAAAVDCSAPATIPEGYEPCCSEAHRPIVRERAWTSPIWYSPPDGEGP
jgi:hypothetical protein